MLRPKHHLYLYVISAPKSRGLFSGYFPTAYVFQTLILLVFWRSFQRVPWQTNKILIFLIFPVFSGCSSLFTFLDFSLFLAYFGISLHIFVINFGKNFGKFQVCTKGKSAIGNRQVRNWGSPSALFNFHYTFYKMA